MTTFNATDSFRHHSSCFAGKTERDFRIYRQHMTEEVIETSMCVSPPAISVDAAASVSVSAKVLSHLQKPLHEQS